MAQRPNGTQRRHVRHRIEPRVEISYQGGDGLYHRLNGICTDISESGIQVEINGPIPVQTYVTITVSNPKLRGSASVRYSRPKGVKFLVGLEFSGGLTWNPEAASAVFRGIR